MNDDEGIVIEGMLLILRRWRYTCADSELRRSYNDACDRLEVLRSKLEQIRREPQR
jgi:hypothetical protein